MNINYPYDYIMNKSTKGFDLAVYSCIPTLINNAFYPECNINVNTISYALLGSLRKRKEIQRSLAQIKQPGIKMINNNNYIINYSEFIYIKDRYISIPYNNIYNIIYSKYTYKYDLLKIYCLIYSGATEMSQTWFMDQMGITSKTTITKYITTLEKMDMILVDRKYKEINSVSIKSN